MADVELFTFPGSNACLTAELVLDHAGIPWRERRLRPMLHVLVLRARGFRRPTAPAARIDGQRVQGSTRIAHAAAQLRPDSGLLPADPVEREAVLAAEAEAERFQNLTRRLVYVLAQDDPALIRPLVDANFGFVPRALRPLLVRVMIRAAVAGHGAARSRAPKDLARAVELLARFDEHVASGVMGNAERPNVADFQLAPNLALLAMAPELEAALRTRACWPIAERLVGRYPLEVRARAPQAWAELITST